jgi:hypothetical protein
MGNTLTMDQDTVDREYERLQQQSNRTADLLRQLSDKLAQRAAQGDPTAREYGLDVREIALSVRDEEQQFKKLLEELDRLADVQAQEIARSRSYQQPVYRTYGYGPGYGGGGGGFFGGGFGQALAMGAGLGLGEEIIEDIF